MGESGVCHCAEGYVWGYLLRLLRLSAIWVMVGGGRLHVDSRQWIVRLLLSFLMRSGSDGEAGLVGLDVLQGGCQGF